MAVRRFLISLTRDASETAQVPVEVEVPDRPLTRAEEEALLREAEARGLHLGSEDQTQYEWELDDNYTNPYLADPGNCAIEVDEDGIEIE